MSFSRIVCDTNFIISAMISPTSVVARTLIKVIQDSELLASQESTRELREVAMRAKFERYAPLASRIDFVERLIRRATMIEIEHTVLDCVDLKDNKFLELALSGNADLIVSGDDHLLRLHPWRGIPILKPADYLAQKI